VQNEERFVWYAINSVIDALDKILVWDLGSTDRTVEIISTIKSDKLVFEKREPVGVEEFPRVRQEMLAETKSDWFLILDGDEVWWEESIGQVVETVQSQGDKLAGIVNPNFSLVGDMFHYQSEEGARYEIQGRKGHFNMRAVNRRTAGLHAAGRHGQQGYFDGQGMAVQDLPSLKWVEAPYLHLTHLARSESREKDAEVAKRKGKFKYELGEEFPRDFYFPEVFFRLDRLEIVPTPWERRSWSFAMKSRLIEPARWLKRQVMRGKSGY